MATALQIVAACSDRKRGKVLPQHRLRAYEHGPQRAAEWMKAVRNGGDRRPAEELYVGNHWFVARSIVGSADTRGWKPRLWAASAGAGLVMGDASLPPYSATFTPRHDDSVIDSAATDGPELQSRSWWRSLTEISGQSLTELTRENPTASLLVIASRSYIDAIAEDLTAAIGLLRHPQRAVIVTSEIPRALALQTHVVIATANMCTQLGGAMTSLHARLARHLVSTLAPAEWAWDRARDLAVELAASSPARVVPQRTPVGDDEVRRFIEGELRQQPDASVSSLLRAFRASGMACEQKRFKDLVHSVRS